MVQTTQPPRREGAQPTTQGDRAGAGRRGLTEKQMEELRELIARRAPLLKELEKH